MLMNIINLVVSVAVELISIGNVMFINWMFLHIEIRSKK